jgi:hypothetical protein
LGLGLLIGIAVAAAAMGGIVLIQPSALSAALGWTSTPASMPIASATLLVLPPYGTFTPSPIVTFTPIPAVDEPTNVPAGVDLSSESRKDPVVAALNSGALVLTGPLPNAKQVALYRASIGYAQANAKDSIEESKKINGVGYGDPTNICGPLAIAILRDAGIISPDINPHDFWLLNPVFASDQRKLLAAFPPGLFVHIIDPTPLNKIDWNVAPLQPGDFLFIWHGSWGNFDHMLVVSRVDSSGRAFAVTNFGTPQGFVIQETMLYDPADRSQGIFHTWTQARDQPLGSTGYGGYELWRARGPGG